MPIKEDLTMSQTDRMTVLTSHDVDVDSLVAEIKENLRLKSKSSARIGHIVCKQHRRNVAPYCKPPPPTTSSSSSKRMTNNSNCATEPYEMLQQLLKERNLIKEAVRRLQLSLTEQKKKSGFRGGDDAEADFTDFTHQV